MAKQDAIRHMQTYELQSSKRTKCAIIAGFFTQSAMKSDVVSYHFPCAFLVQSSSSSGGAYWVQQEGSVYFSEVGGSATVLQKERRGCSWVAQLAVMTLWKAKTHTDCHKSQVPGEVQQTRQPWRLLSSFNAHTKNYSSCPPKHTFSFKMEKKSKLWYSHKNDDLFRDSSFICNFEYSFNSQS